MKKNKPELQEKTGQQAPLQSHNTDDRNSGRLEETGGPKGPEPTRYGDWERKGRCIDF